MHDPLTLTFEIRWMGLQIWHKDPERRGDDDSCGWFKPHLTSDEEREVREFVRWEAESGSLFDNQAMEHVTQFDSGGEYRRRLVSVGDCAALSLAAAQALSWRCWRLRVNDRMAMRALRLGVTVSDDGFRGMFCERDSEDRVHLMMHFLRWWKAELRPCWRHPRWHLHHWRVYWRPAARAWRWMFDRCCKCRKRFGWRESAMTDWDGTKRWHTRCDTSKVKREEAGHGPG